MLATAAADLMRRMACEAANAAENDAVELNRRMLVVCFDLLLECVKAR